MDYFFFSLLCPFLYVLYFALPQGILIYIEVVAMLSEQFKLINRLQEGRVRVAYG